LSNLSAVAEHVVLLLSPRPCHGLTLILDAGQLWEYYVCNLSTGEHVALPPCERAAGRDHTTSVADAGAHWHRVPTLD
jgi:hypothetical protein